jgi:hypothetical protein
MKKIFLMSMFCIVLISCDGLGNKKKFSGAANYETSRNDAVKKIAQITDVDTKSINISWSTYGKAFSTNYSIGVTINNAPVDMFNDSISKLVSNQVYKVLQTKVINLNDYDSFILTIREESKENEITKRRDYMIEKEIEK